MWPGISLLTTIRVQLMMLLLKEPPTGNWVKPVRSEAAEVAQPRDTQLRARALRGRGTPRASERGVREEPAGAGGSLELLGGCGRELRSRHRVPCGVGLWAGSSSVAGLRPRVARAVSRPRAVPAAPQAPSAVRLCCGGFHPARLGVLRGAIWGACEPSHLWKFTVLTSSTRCYLASLLESLSYGMCK